MSSRTRRFVLWISAPVVAFAIVGGFLTQVLAREDTYQHLKIFDDVVGLISSNYVESADIDKVMAGAMSGLAETLDPDSAYLSAEQVKAYESGAALPAGDVGIDLTRQYYLRVIATRDNSPADRAGLQTGDYVRAIGDRPTRQMSVFEGMRALRGAPGSRVEITVIRGNSNDPHVITLTREAIPDTVVSGRMAAPGVGYVRIAAIGAKTPDQVKTQVASLTRAGASRLIVDVRGVSGGQPAQGLALARLFVESGTLVTRETKGADPVVFSAERGNGEIRLPMVLLADTGTSSAAEVFASALAGNTRAEVIGERTLGRAAEQSLVKLPDGSALWLTTSRYLNPDGSPLHEHGVEPSIEVDQPLALEFGQELPEGDPILEKALEHLAERQAA
jgi:carboxyl-terminal processing protease